MNPFKTEEHKAFANHLLHLPHGDADVVPHLAHADYLEENGYPLYAHIIRTCLDQDPPNRFGLVPTSLKDEPGDAGEAHSHHAESDDPGRPLSINYKDGKNTADVSYHLTQHNSKFMTDPHVGMVYPATLPLEQLIKHTHLQHQENPAEDTKNLLDQLNQKRPKLFDEVVKDPHKYAKEYEFLLKFNAE